MSTPADFSSMLTSMASLPSFSALRDYMKLFVLGGAFEALRRTYSVSYASLVERFFIKASFDSEDDVYREPHFLHNPTLSLPILRLDDVLAVFSSPMASVSRLYSYY
jgi:hypothetical protein